LDRARGSVEKEKEAQHAQAFSEDRELLKVFFLFCQKYKFCRRSMENFPACKNFLKEATGVQLNGCAALWVCS
jgi:ectoine hydroxylase-related dioxygenase (phytanoyl-CoA dioxygenase family)